MFNLIHNSFPLCLFQFSTFFEQPRAHHRENQSYLYNIWYMSLYVGDPFCVQVGKELSDLHTKWVTDTEWHIPDGV